MAKAKERSQRNPGPLAPGMAFDDVVRRICSYKPARAAKKELDSAPWKQNERIDAAEQKDKGGE